MARKRYRPNKLPLNKTPPPLFDLDSEARLWLARAALHQFLSDPSDDELPRGILLTLEIEPAPDEEDDAPRTRRGAGSRRRAATIAAVEQRIAQLERATRGKHGRMMRAARRITSIFGIETDGARVLAWLAACELHGELAALSRIGELDTHRQRLLLAGAAIDVPCRRLEAVLGRKGELQQHGLVVFDEHGSSINSFTLPRRLLALFGVERATKERVLESLLSAGPAPRFCLDDFSYVRELPLLAHALRGALESKARPVHILLHGAPGTGKSELARTLARSVGARLCELPTEDEDGDELGTTRRTSELRLLDSVAAAQRGRTCLLVDEADDLLPRRERSLWGGFLAGGVDSKGFYNELLESMRAPTLWTANSADNLDEAHLRRFSLIVEVRAPPRTQRRAIAERHADSAHLDAALLHMIADDERVPLALLETITKTFAMTRTSDNAKGGSTLPAVPDAQTIVRQVTNGFLQVSGKAPPSRPRPSKLAFDASLLNASLDLGAVVTRLAQHPHATVLLSGPPGAGKSAWARALADALGRPLVVRGPSDLLSKYVGESEKNLARAFAAAEAEGAVLLLDEADTFLFPRSEARQSWEISQTNEMLVRVESFGGILVATTNSERLDEAIVRRFDLKVALKPLSLEQRARLFALLCDAVAVPPPTPEEDARLAALDQLCAGDFVAVERRLRFCDPTTAADVFAALEEERAHKKGLARARIGF